MDFETIQVEPVDQPREQLSGTAELAFGVVLLILFVLVIATPWIDDWIQGKNRK